MFLGFGFFLISAIPQVFVFQKVRFFRNTNCQNQKWGVDNPKNTGPPCHPFLFIKTLSWTNLSITFEGDKIEEAHTIYFLIFPLK